VGFPLKPLDDTGALGQNNPNRNENLTQQGEEDEIGIYV
jgi:hypothetical protein